MQINTVASPYTLSWGAEEKRWTDDQIAWKLSLRDLHLHADVHNKLHLGHKHQINLIKQATPEAVWLPPGGQGDVEIKDGEWHVTRTTLLGHEKWAEHMKQGLFKMIE